METVNISLVSMGLAFALLLVPLGLSLFFRFKLIKQIFYSTFRMTAQLVLIGIFLKYLFKWDNSLINFIWLTIMILVAVFSSIRNAAMKISSLFLPAFISFFLSTFLVVLYLNALVIPTDSIMEAKYLIVLGGMLLGNCLRGNIIGISTFYNKLRQNDKNYLYTLSLGASQFKALLPHFQRSVELALKPTLASMATMGIVALPGMMTGVILGGADPETAIKYQIVIVVAIVVSTISSVVFSILLSLKLCFDKYGILRKDIFINHKKSSFPKKIPLIKR
ncbi:MAG: ABC transporter permease [Myxococcota bacterium]